MPILYTKVNLFIQRQQQRQNKLRAKCDGIYFLENTGAKGRF